VTQGEGPGHSLDATNEQLFDAKTVTPSTKAPAIDDRGFVSQYKNELAADKAAGGDLSAVMQTFNAGQLPALTALAQNFVLCDQWYSEVPGPTMPNRQYIHAATSAGWARDDFSVELDQVTIYEQLQNNSRTWSVYYSDQNEVAQYTRINTERANFKIFETSFAADAAAGKLANYTFIIPRFASSTTDGPANSMHAPFDVRPGDQLIASVYAALRASPQWMQSLLVVTFDEHGGYFDHATPAAAVNPDGIDSPAPGDTVSFAPTFAFDRLGLRVPALLASPYLPKGTVCSTPLQHTSTLVTTRKLLGITGSLTKRDAAATGFDPLFLKTARTDTPTTLTSSTETSAGHPGGHAAKHSLDKFTAGMAHDWRKTAARHGLPTGHEPKSADEAHHFLRSTVGALLDARAKSRHKG
jgi:phospholipase C